MSAVMQGSPGGDTRPAASEQETTLVPPTYELPSHPFTPMWAPEGAGEPYATTLGTVDSLCQEAVDGTLLITTNVSADPPGSLTGEEVTIQGRDAVLRNLPGVVTVTWHHEPGQWVTVRGEPGITAAAILQYANELTEKPFPVLPSFTFDLVPTGAVLRIMTRRAAMLIPSAAGGTAAGTGSIAVLLSRGRTGNAEPVEVGERAGVYLGDDTMHVFLDHGLVLAVYASGTFSLSREDLVRFAAGVHVTPHARPFT